MCKATRESRRWSVARVVPSMCTADLPRGGAQPQSQTLQYERKRRVASVFGIKVNVFASPLRRFWCCDGRSPLRKSRLCQTVVLECLCSRPVVQNPCVGSTYVHRYRRSYDWRHAHRQLAFPGVRPLGVELADMVRLAALEALVQLANRMGVVHASRTREGTISGKSRGLGRSRPCGLRGLRGRPSPWDHPFVEP